MEITAAPEDGARAELEARLRAYVPTRVEPAVWAGVLEDALALVMAAGAPTWHRARKDLGVIADVAAHLAAGRETVTLDAILRDEALSAFDCAHARAGAAGGTRENKRGRWRRLQAAYRGVPWHRGRRGDGQRVATLVQPEVAERLSRLLPGDGAASAPGPRAVQAALDHARRRRRGLAGDAIDPRVWAAARAHARSLGTSLTQRDLHALATYEFLAGRVPAATLIVDARLTRRDLDHALAVARRLPVEPEDATAGLLRG